jgi:hypothetical protein
MERTEMNSLPQHLIKQAAFCLKIHSQSVTPRLLKNVCWECATHCPQTPDTLNKLLMKQEDYNYLIQLMSEMWNMSEDSFPMLTAELQYHD